MCEVTERYGDERTIEIITVVVKNIMESTNYSLEKIFNIIKISEKDRKLVVDRLSKWDERLTLSEMREKATFEIED